MNLWPLPRQGRRSALRSRWSRARIPKTTGQDPSLEFPPFHWATPRPAVPSTFSSTRMPRPGDPLFVACAEIRTEGSRSLQEVNDNLGARHPQSAARPDPCRVPLSPSDHCSAGQGVTSREHEGRRFTRSPTWGHWGIVGRSTFATRVPTASARSCANGRADRITLRTQSSGVLDSTWSGREARPPPAPWVTGMLKR